MINHAVQWLAIHDELILRVLVAIPLILILGILLFGLWVGSYHWLARRDLVPNIREKHRHHRQRAVKGKGFDITELARRLDTTELKLQMIDLTYRQVDIPKKHGGTRTLHVPNPELKAIQKKILRRLLARLKAHPCNMAFEKKKSIVDNARQHVGQAVVIRMDIKNFFDSTKRQRVESYFRRIGWNAQTAAILANLTCHETGLPQGAPTSPRLGNLVNYVMDAHIARYVNRHRGHYTRYADDITISYPKDFPRYVRGTVQTVRYRARKHGYTVHLRNKLRICRKHQQQRVTGLVVNQKVQLPRSTRRWLRAVEHRLKTQGTASLTESQLAGWRSFQQMIAKQAEAGHPVNPLRTTDKTTRPER